MYSTYYKYTMRTTNIQCVLQIYNAYYKYTMRNTNTQGVQQIYNYNNLFYLM